MPEAEEQPQERVITEEHLRKCYVDCTKTQMYLGGDAESLHGLQYKLGIPATVASIISTSVVFMQLEEQRPLAVDILVGVMTLSAAILMGILTLYDPENQRHKRTNARAVFRDLARRFDVLIATARESEGSLRREFHETYDLCIEELNEAGISLPVRISKKVKEPGEPPRLSSL